MNCNYVFLKSGCKVALTGIIIYVKFLHLHPICQGHKSIQELLEFGSRDEGQWILCPCLQVKIESQK